MVGDVVTSLCMGGMGVHPNLGPKSLQSDRQSWGFPMALFGPIGGSMCRASQRWQNAKYQWHILLNASIGCGQSQVFACSVV